MKENKIIGIKIEQAEKPIISRDNINILLESNRDVYSNMNYDSGGLGFRASLPKMPSFRRKKIPSPVPEDEDEDEIHKTYSDSEEIVHYPDLDATRPPPHRERKDSSSSNASSSSFSSSSDSDSSDESSSDSETEVKQMNRRSASPAPEEDKVQTEVIDIIESFSPMRTEIEPSNKTPEPMQVSWFQLYFHR